MRTLAIAAVTIILLSSPGCSRPESLTAEKAEEIVREGMFRVTPVYAEVPQRVTWSPASPRDDYDEISIRTLRNLEEAGLVTIEEAGAPDGSGSLTARATPEGFRILGTVPSARGPAFRARIAEKNVDGMRNFVQHPGDPTVGRAEVVWHYQNPTRWYPLFETKIDKPLDRPFATLVSFRWEKGAWHFGVTAEKVEPIDD